VSGWVLAVRGAATAAVSGLAAFLLLVHSAAALELRLVPPSPRQGDVALVLLAGARGAREIEGSLGGRRLVFFPYGEEHAALTGIDLEAKPGKVAWRVGVIDAGDAPRELSGTAVVRRRAFPVERLDLPSKMVDLDAATERRADSEAARLNTLYAMLTPERLWHGRFVRPVGGSGPGSGFGARRIINGKPRMPHSGVDYKAARGTPVVAANRGRVALVAEFFFAGRLAVLDHGLGLYTLYFHLDRVDVAEGALVERGETIGAVGSTGRATGPHLHWAAELRQARIDPSALLALRASD
jgi:murein DD-endopeptidase MepM/ murein hydrolase activator NlpD